MSASFSRKTSDLLLYLCACLGLSAIGLFIFVAAQTLTYPFHIEWMEGQVIDVIGRVRHGLPVYARPSMEYVPFAYTPYYYYVAALVSLFTGVDFLPGRLVSFASALGTGGILYAWLRREGASRPIALTGAGAYFSTYILTGRWMDVARVDSLFLFLTLAGLYGFYFHRTGWRSGWQGRAVTAAIMTAACFTKQTAAIAMAPAFGAMLLINWRHSLQVAGMVLAAVVALSVAGHIATDGWFTFFVYQLEAGHGIQKQHILGFWRRDLLPHVGIMMGLGGLLVVYGCYREWKKGLWYGALALGFIGCSYAARLNWGGYLNVLMPACCILALLTGMALAQARHFPTPWPAIAVSLLVMAQFALLAYNPYRYIPGRQSVIEGNRFLEALSKIDGEIFMPEVQFVQTRVGKKSYALGMAALDLIVTDMKEKNTIKQALINEIRQAIAQQRFGAVMPGGVVPVPGANRYYYPAMRLKYPKEYVSQTRNFLRRTLMLPRSGHKVIGP